MKEEENIKQRIRRYLDGMYTKSETSELLKDVRDAGMRDILEDVSEEIWEESINRKSFSCDAERELFKKEASILLRKINKRHSYKKILWAAACVIFVLTIGLIGIKNFQPVTKEEIRYTQVTTPFGEKKELVLPDGSKVILNACTTIKYPEVFVGKERRIELIGEAYFQINRNEKQPFFIKTTKFSVRVLGTKFGIKAYSGNEIALVSVESGKVQVDLPEAMVKLIADEQVQINVSSDEFVKRKEDHNQAMAWLQGKLYYDSTSIHDVIKDLERIYNCRIKFTKGQVFNYQLSGEHDNRSLQSVLQSIEYATGIKSKQEDGYILLYKAP